MTWIQRWVMKDKKMSRRRRTDYEAMKAEARALNREELATLRVGRPAAARAQTADAAVAEDSAERGI